MKILFRPINFKIVKKGFTLVELLVTVAITASLIAALYFSLNPLGQLDKGRDAKRKRDINQVADALNLFYHDKNCFPDEASFATILNSGGEWSENSGATVYMKEVPKDDNTAYTYRASTATCPSWAVVFAKLSKPQESLTCELNSVPNCMPAGFDASYACAVLGSPDCTELSN